MKSAPHGKYHARAGVQRHGKTESAAEKESLRDLARQGIVYHGGGSSNAGCRQKRQEMRAAYKEYEDSYINGYADALEDMRRWQRERRQREQDRQTRRWYFLK